MFDPCPIDTGFDTTPVTATVSPALAPAPATVETGFGDLGGTPAPVQPNAPKIETVADRRKPCEPDADLDACVADLLPNRSITDWNAASAFMGAVVPWPASQQDAGWIVMPNGYVGKNAGGRLPTGKYPIGPGKPFKDVDTFVSHVAWATRQTSIKDLFFCLSMQREVGMSSKGKPQGKRTAAGAMAVKAIWIDVDVGKEGAYADVTEALKAAITFREAIGLPPFSAIVGSGGGIHLYWISDRALTPDEWRPYAEGLKASAAAQCLKCDLGVTTDIARMLRVPGTFNHKEKEPRPCQLFNVPLKLYNFENELEFLTKTTPIGQVHAPSGPPHSIYVDGVTTATFGTPHPLFIDIKEPGLQAGIDKHSDIPLDPRPIFKECTFYRDAFLNGGKDYDQQLWMYSILGTTFMENGCAYAHEISKGHATYTPADTDAMYDRKLGERRDRGIGYPSCAAIAGAGCQSCSTCPLLAEGKSPLNIRPVVTATVTDTSSPSNSSGQAKWTGQSGISFAHIPHRKWLYGFDLVRGELTVIGSPGGAGKSSLAIGMAICVTTDRELLGEKLRGGGNLRALVINGEDSTDEIRRRIYAFCLAHGVAEHDLDGLTFAGADDLRVQRISFLTTSEKGISALNQGGFDALQLALDALHPDVIVLDPLVSFCAGGNMNDNAVMSLVMRKLKEIAAQYECAVLIVHHTRKGGEAGNVETISGAAAITNLARRAIMPAPLTAEEATKLGILPSERLQYFRLVDAKSNLAPRATDSPLYWLHSVELPNPEPPLYPHGDAVQAITRVVLPIQPSGVASADDMKIEAAILNLVDDGKEIDGQAYPYSPSLAGATNERALLPDAMVAVANATAPRHWAPGDLEVVIRTAINKMQADGRLVIAEMGDLMPKPGRFRRARGLKAVPI
jgi:AAA domain